MVLRRVLYGFRRRHCHMGPTQHFHNIMRHGRGSNLFCLQRLRCCSALHTPSISSILFLLYSYNNTVLYHIIYHVSYHIISYHIISYRNKFLILRFIRLYHSAIDLYSAILLQQRLAVAFPGLGKSDLPGAQKLSVRWLSLSWGVQGLSS